MSNNGGKISHSSPCSSRSLNPLPKFIVEIPKTSSVRKTAYAKFGSIKRRSRKNRKVRKSSKAFRKRTIEVIDLSSDDETNASDVELLEEVIDISGSDVEHETQKYTAKGQDGESASEAGADSGETDYPGSKSSSVDGDSPLPDLSFDSLSSISIGSPFSDLRSVSPFEDVESAEADLPVSDETNGSGVEINSSEEMVVEITPLEAAEGEQGRISQSESEVSSPVGCGGEEPIQGDQEVPVVPEDQEMPSMQVDQEVPAGQKDQDGVNDNVEQCDGVTGHGMSSDRQDVGPDQTGLDGEDKGAAPEATQVVPMLGDLDCPLEAQCVLEENLSVEHTVFLNRVDDSVHLSSDD